MRLMMNSCFSWSSYHLSLKDFWSPFDLHVFRILIPLWEMIVRRNTSFLIWFLDVYDFNLIVLKNGNDYCLLWVISVGVSLHLLIEWNQHYYEWSLNPSLPMCSLSIWFIPDSQIHFHSSSSEKIQVEASLLCYYSIKYWTTESISVMLFSAIILPWKYNDVID